jgi:hypothetical protein
MEGNKTSFKKIVILVIIFLILTLITYSANGQVGLDPNPPIVQMSAGDTITIVIENFYAGDPQYATIWEVWYLSDLNPDWIGEIIYATDTTATLVTHEFPCDYWGSPQYCWYTVEVRIIDLNQAYVLPAEFQSGSTVYHTVGASGIHISKL